MVIYPPAVAVNAPVRNQTAAITGQSTRLIQTEVSWLQPELVGVPVQDMAALFPMPWWIFKRESSRSTVYNDIFTLTGD